MSDSLSGSAYHDSCACLIADFFQPLRGRKHGNDTQIAFYLQADASLRPYDIRVTFCRDEAAGNAPYYMSRGEVSIDLRRHGKSAHKSPVSSRPMTR